MKGAKFTPNYEIWAKYNRSGENFLIYIKIIRSKYFL